jgi:predicted DNA-binding WGR domain protein
MVPVNSTVNLASLAVQYERIGQLAGEQWRRPYDMTAAAYISLLRRVPDGAGLRGYLQLVAADKADRLVNLR